MSASNIEDIEFARKVIRWMHIGITPSQSNALKAQHTLKDFASESQGSDVDLKTAIRVTGAIGLGLVPSVQACEQARDEITLLMDSMREVDSSALRSNFRQQV